ncbi:MAG: BMP family ABC transporter substrate-binding protein [Clostridium sp.]|nr:BMP family ABC transporter substrate-binding protein [Clostridium sp.]
MKKIISVLLCLVLVCGVFVGCAKQDELKSDIVLITNGGTIKDGGYNQSAWEGISSYADENGLTCRYYQPVLDNDKITTENVEKYVELSAKNGAQFIVLPGNEFAVPAYEIANSYPDLKFILVDAIPHSADSDIDSYLGNVMCVSFDCLQSGFLAGYISVINGNTQLGYFGDVKSKESAAYGAGFVQGAAYAADTLGVPTTVQWADYNSALIDYDYDFTITACYKPVSESDETTYVIKVENGIGSGTYTEGSNVTITADSAPVGQVFDHWEVKSDTEGVKDKKVNISSEKESSMNLVVEKCDATITAVYKDIEGDYKNVTVMCEDGKTPFAQYGVAVDGGVSVTAPVAERGMVFDHWDTTADLGDTDLTSKEIWVAVKDADITLVPVYAASENPTFNVTVVTGEGGTGDSTGSGSYVAGDKVELAAALPAEGYMFSHWSNEDSYGLGTGIAMENEFYWNTSFEMVDRFASVCEAMYNQGVNTIFNGGSEMSQSAYTAKWNYDYNQNVISAGENNKDAYTTIVKNYGEAIKDCLADFKGGSPNIANCSTDGIYATFVSENEDIQKQYDAVYKALADNEIELTQVQEGAGYDFCLVFNEKKPSKCLTLDGWFLDSVQFKK